MKIKQVEIVLNPIYTTTTMIIKELQQQICISRFIVIALFFAPLTNVALEVMHYSMYFQGAPVTYIRVIQILMNSILFFINFYVMTYFLRTFSFILEYIKEPG